MVRLIALDSSVLIPFLTCEETDATRQVADLVAENLAILPQVVVTEVLSNRVARPELQATLSNFRTLPVLNGYWMRAGLLRSSVLAQQRRARLADTLVAQACIDADVRLLTRDKDFQAFAEIGGLRLA